MIPKNFFGQSNIIKLKILKVSQVFNRWKWKPNLARQPSCGSSLLYLCQRAVLTLWLLSFPSDMTVPAGIQFQMFSPLLSWWEAWMYADRPGFRKVVESSVPGTLSSRKRTDLSYSELSAYPLMTLVLQQSHIYSNKVTTLNSATHWLWTYGSHPFLFKATRWAYSILFYLFSLDFEIYFVRY